MQVEIIGPRQARHWWLWIRIFAVVWFNIKIVACLKTLPTFQEIETEYSLLSFITVKV